MNKDEKIILANQVSGVVMFGAINHIVKNVVEVTVPQQPTLLGRAFVFFGRIGVAMALEAAASKEMSAIIDRAAKTVEKLEETKGS